MYSHPNGYSKMSPIGTGAPPFRGELQRGPCVMCQHETSNKCTRCQQVYYCCKKHQDQHRVVHKSQCHRRAAPVKQSLEVVPNKRTRATSSGLEISEIEIPKCILTLAGIPLTFEDPYIKATNIIEAGNVIFNELPIFVAPNYVKHIVTETGAKKTVKSYCVGCMLDFKGIADDQGYGVSYTMCNMCKLPLCKFCYNKKETDKHSQYECEAIVDATKKLGDVLNLKNQLPYQNEDLIKDLSILRALLLQKTSPSQWDSLINLKTNVRFKQSVKTPIDKVEVWIQTYTPISENYVQVINQHGENSASFRLNDVKRIIALFSEPSPINPRIRVMYELKSWMPQSCRPNTAWYTVSVKENEKYCHEISVKSVNEIKQGDTISFNYINNYEGGLSKAAVNIFSETALICRCLRCKFTQEDLNVAVRCDVEGCRGYLSPKVEQFDPSKSLDLHGISQMWDCSICYKRRKFSSVQAHVTKTVEDISKEIEMFGRSNSITLGGELKDKLDRRLHEHHWLRVKVNMMVLERINDKIGYGNEMLKYSMIKNKPVSQSKFNQMIETKLQIYVGYGGRLGFLKLISDQRGLLSEIAGVHLFDAFYVFYIDFIEKYKEQLMPNSKNSNFTQMTIQDHRRLLADLKEMINTIRDAHLSLSMSENPKYQAYAKIAKETWAALKKVHENSLKSPRKLENYLHEFLMVYARLDSKLYSALLSVSRKKSRNNSMLDDCSDVTLKFSDLRCESEDEAHNSGKNAKKFRDDANSSSNESYDSQDFERDYYTYESYMNNMFYQDEAFAREFHNPECCLQ